MGIVAPFKNTKIVFGLSRSFRFCRQNQVRDQDFTGGTGSFQNLAYPLSQGSLVRTERAEAVTR